MIWGRNACYIYFNQKGGANGKRQRTERFRFFEPTELYWKDA
jgi:hypothetical protein